MLRVARTLLACGGIAAACLFASLPARAQTACETYTVRAGDTLSSIAQRAGVPGGFQILFSANRDVVATPTALQIGMVLRIPCADGTLPGAAPEAAATVTPAAAATTTPAEPAGELPTIKFLTGGNFSPFTDETAAELGLFPELVAAALRISAPDLEYKIIFVNDWDSHLSALLPSGAFDMGFPWHLPDCSDLSQLSVENAIRCLDYRASDPFFEAVIGFYAKVDSPFAAATSLDALQGARLCRPEGWFTFDLEAAGLADELTMGRIATTCWNDLSAGKIDVVTYDAFTAEEDIVALGLAGQIAELSGLSSVATLHVFAPNRNANGQAYLDLLNDGLKQMRANGEWFAIVSKHLSAHNQLVGGGN